MDCKAAKLNPYRNHSPQTGVQEMKMATQHKSISISTDGKKPVPYRKHRNHNTVWVTGGDKNTTIMSRVFEFVSEAKAWMNEPTIS